jgi:hypothetical protein
VRHQNTVFHTVLQHLPWDEFERLVKVHGADKDERGFTAKTQLVAMIYGQLSGTGSLREIVAGLSSHQTRLYHLGIGKVCRSTLADANAHRPSGLFSDLFAALVQRAHRGLRRQLDGTTYLIDSTSVALKRHSEHWARFSAEVCRAKVHVVYDPDADQPVYSAFSAANVNDITAAKARPIEAGATPAFDEGRISTDLPEKVHFLPRIKILVERARPPSLLPFATLEYCYVAAHSRYRIPRRSTI